MFKKKSPLQKIPRPFIIGGFVSIGLNIILLGTIITGYTLESTGSFDMATVNSGIDKLCSDEFRQTVIESSKGMSENERGIQLALVDYPCSNNGAQDFYQKGFKDYVQTLGLKY